MGNSRSRADDPRDYITHAYLGREDEHFVCVKVWVRRRVHQRLVDQLCQGVERVEPGNPQREVHAGLVYRSAFANALRIALHPPSAQSRDAPRQADGESPAQPATTGGKY